MKEHIMNELRSKIRMAGDRSESFNNDFEENRWLMEILASVAFDENIHNDLKNVKELANNMKIANYLKPYMHLFLAFVDTYGLDLKSKKGGISRNRLMSLMENQKVRQLENLNDLVTYLFPEVKAQVESYREWVRKVHDYQAPSSRHDDLSRYSGAFNPELR